LVRNTDCHFLAALTSLVQSILEGRTDCPISGVFGAGKTRAAAAMIGGLLVVDPTQLRVLGPPLEFPGEHGILENIYAEVRAEESLITLQYLGGQQDIPTRRMKKRKQIDDNAGTT